MELIIVVAFLFALLLCAFVVWQSWATRRYLDARLGPQPLDLAQTLSAVQQALQQNIQVGQQLGQLSKATEQMLRVGEDISSLQDILQPPKLRGGLGELSLRHLLEQILPLNAYEEQYRFKSGQMVDVVIRVGDGLVPVDSKFPLDDFKRLLEAASEQERDANRRRFARAVRGHIDDVAKYILPAEGTFDFAMMYVPAENVYYEMIVKDDSLGDGEGLQDYAMRKHVFPVSPNSFYAYLMAIVHGLRGLRIEKRAQEIYGHLQGLTKEFERFRGEFDTLGTHIRHASNKYDNLDRMVGRFEDRLSLPLEPPDEELPESLPEQGR